MSGLEQRDGRIISNSHCVLWRHPSEEVPQPLMRSLSHRIEKTVLATDGYEAFAEVCSITAQAARLGRPCAVVLLLLKPLRLADAGQVLHYLDMYAPRTRRWRFDPSATPIFAPMSEHDVAKLNPGLVRSSKQGGAETGSAMSSTGTWPAITVPSRAAQRPGQSRSDQASPGRAASSVGASRGTPIFPSLGDQSGLGTPKPRPTPQPKLRLVQSDPMADTLVGNPAAADLGSLAAQLTPEELSMLLSDPPAD